ncbi:PA3496 family putative envelope integrity protein [Litoribrevibacter euphylliae]|uniref:PA3496 family putative envelope integrity protein n=1 Tax=Litoribrevibacter euphylliae TaxID=1834034 RepID=A0ABV7HDB1_9GAMM
MGAAEELYIEEYNTKSDDTKEKGRRGRKNTAAKRLAARRNIEAYQEEKQLTKDLEEFWFDEL